jgi:hypothetical protein
MDNMPRRDNGLRRSDRAGSTCNTGGHEDLGTNSASAPWTEFRRAYRGLMAALRSWLEPLDSGFGL